MKSDARFKVTSLSVFPSLPRAGSVQEVLMKPCFEEKSVYPLFEVVVQVQTSVVSIISVTGCQIHVPSALITMMSVGKLIILQLLQVVRCFIIIIITPQQFANCNF